MIMWTKIRVAAAIAIVILLPGILCVNAVQRWARGEDERSSAPASAASTAEFTMATNIFMETSLDKTQAFGFSMRTGGEWAKASAPTGATFDRSTIFLATDVGVIQAGDREFGFSPGTGTWDSIQLPDTRHADIVVATGICAFQDGDRVYGFSGIHGGWDSFQVPAGTKVVISVGEDWAMAQYGTHTWTLSAAGGKWRGIDVAETGGGHL